MSTRQRMSDSQWIQTSKEYRRLKCGLPDLCSLKKIFNVSIWNVKKSSAVLKLQRIILKSKRGAVSERKIFLKKEKTYVAHLLAKTTHCVAWYRERFVFAQPDSSQEFSDAKKFYASKTPNNLKRIILKRKRAVSEWEIFWKRRKKIPCTFIIGKTDLTSCFQC